MLYVFVVIVRAFRRASVLQRLSVMKDFQLEICTYICGTSQKPDYNFNNGYFYESVPLYKLLFLYITRGITDLQREIIKIFYFGHI